MNQSSLFTQSQQLPMGSPLSSAVLTDPSLDILAESVSPPNSSELVSGSEEELRSGIQNSLDWLHDHQDAEGYWVGMLESNSCMEAEWILAMHVLGIKNDPKQPGVVQAILNQQREDGAWEVYHGAETGDINTTVECYAALRVAGLELNSAPLASARRWILHHNAMSQLRNFTKYWLALIGEWPWEQTPTLPPEVIFLPKWAPFNITQFATWARGTIVPLLILSARRPVYPLAPEHRLDELFPQGRQDFDFRLPRKQSLFSATGFFYVTDSILNRYVNFPLKPFRETAIKYCLEWILKRQEADGAWSGIQPPWIYSLMALKHEGYELQHPVMQAGLKAFDAHWSYECDGGTYLQASESPVWDTGLSLLAMLECDQQIDDSPSMQSALNWLIEKQVTLPGDWKIHSPNLDGGGWAFQRANLNYPDLDDTAVILQVLCRIRSQKREQCRRLDFAIDRATNWIMGLQCSNGGWAAYDRDNNKSWLTNIPFCDFGEVIDPPSVDVTSHVIEALIAVGKKNHPAILRALDYIRGEQEADGSWFGRWGVNYVYGTAAVLPALHAAGLEMNQEWIRRAGNWLCDKQNSDGGWGETCASYMDENLRGIGPSTASQTGWALMGLLAFPGQHYEDAIRRGVSYLLTTQSEGTWEEPEYTGTGFPGYGVGDRINLQAQSTLPDQDTALQRGFMLNYNMYRHYFPLMALGRAQRTLTQS